MKKTPYLRSKQRHLSKFVLIWTIFLFILMLCGCAKTAPETATDALLTEIGAVEQQIKKECPQAKIDKQIDALRASAQSQLKTCEAQIATIEAQRNTWVVVSGGLVLVMLAYFLGKARKIV